MKTSLQESLKQFERKQIIVSLLGFLIITGLSVISNRIFMQSSAEQTTNLITRMVQNGYFHEIELTLQSAKLDCFHTIRFNSKSLNRSFTFPALAEYVHERSLFDVFLYEKIELRPQIMSTSANEDIITFEYNRFGFVGYGFVIWLILNLVSIPQTRLIKNRIIEQFNRDIELMKKSSQTEISRKVRHNINTPLAALIAMTDRLENLGKNDQILFESIVKQIKSLMKDLDTSELGAGPNTSKQQVSASIFNLIRDSFHEVKAAFSRDYDIEFEIQNSLMSGKTSLIPHEFRSIISNLVQNAVDATPAGGKIMMTARDLSNQVEIKIKDSGKGMPQEVLNRATEKNFTSSKVNGSGLGLYHAKTYIESWGGDLSIESTENVGTTITIHLPISERASWFAPRIKIKSNQTVVILDDQISQHHVWDLKLAENGFHGDVKKFTSPKDFLEFKEIADFSDETKHVFFFDYDLGAGEIPGLGLLKEVSALAQRHLVTGHFDDHEVQEACSQENIFLIPKTDVPELPIVIIDPSCI